MDYQHLINGLNSAQVAVLELMATAVLPGGKLTFHRHCQGYNMGVGTEEAVAM